MAFLPTGIDDNWIFALTLHSVGVLVLSVSVYFAVASLERRLEAAGRLPPGLKIVRRFVLPSIIFMISLSLGIFPNTVDVPARVGTVLLTLAKFGATLSAMTIALRTIGLCASVSTHHLETSHTDDLRQRRLRTQIQYLEKILDIVVIFIALTAILVSFESFRRLGGSLLASAGLASVILGFSAQKSLGNLLAGFQIAFTQPIRLGDAVFVENEWGVIEEITLTYVVVRIWDLRRLILPITYFLEKPFQNWTRSSSELIGQVLLQVDYSVPIGELRNELERIVHNSALWDKRVCNLAVTDSGAQTLTVRALVSARDSGTTFDLRCEVREGLIGFILNAHPHALPRTRLEGDSRRLFVGSAASAGRLGKAAPDSTPQVDLS